MSGQLCPERRTRKGTRSSGAAITRRVKCLIFDQKGVRMCVCVCIHIAWMVVVKLLLWIIVLWNLTRISLQC